MTPLHLSPLAGRGFKSSPPGELEGVFHRYSSFFWFANSIYPECIPTSPKTGKDLWQVVKPYVRQIQSEQGIMIVDDSISEKPHTDENDLICWHYDHTTGQNIKGINFVMALYHANHVSLPVNYQLITRTEIYTDQKTGKQKRRSAVSKNEVYRQLLHQVVGNQIPFRSMVNDVWFAAADNMMFVVHELKRHFVMPLKSNRKVP